MGGDWIVVHPDVMELLKKFSTEDEQSNQRVFGSILRGPTIRGIRIYVDANLPRDKMLTSASLGAGRKTPLLRLVESVFDQLG